MRDEVTRVYFREAQRRRRKCPEVQQRDRENTHRYYLDNKIKILKRQGKRKMERYRTDPEFRLRENLRSRTILALKGKIKSGLTLTLVGCSWTELRSHLERQFQPGMSWENYGKWQVDHRAPCASFDFRDPRQQAACFHFSNLQPLWAVDNRRKGSKLVKE